MDMNLLLNTIIYNSPIIASMVANGEIAIIGGVHNIATGEVKFFE